MTSAQRASGSILHPNTHRIDGVDQFSGLAELHEALPQVVERPFNQDLLLLVVVQQVVPQRLLGQGLWVPHNDHAVSVPRAQNPKCKHTGFHHVMSKQTSVSADVSGRPSEVLPRTSQCNVEASGVVEEADALVLIGPHTRQDDEVLLSALKSVHTCNFHFLHPHGESDKQNISSLVKIHVKYTNTSKY